jgi:hypothetical protein
MRWGVYGIVLGIQILVTIRRFITSCKELSLVAWGMYIIHHFLDVFLFWSFLFLTEPIEYILHILLVIGVAIHWFSYENRCVATVYMNRLCGFPEDEWMDSLKNMTGLRKVSEYFQFVWLGVLVLLDIFLLYK